MKLDFDFIPKKWIDLLKKIRNENGKFHGLQDRGKWIGALEALLARRLVIEKEDGYYQITSAGNAVMEEIEGKGVLYSIDKESKVLNEIRVEISRQEKNFSQSLKQKRNVGKENYRNIFINAKLWNSATPIFPPTRVEASQGKTPEGGGGYILLWDEICLCIDPGLNFLTRFYRRGFNPNDIDGIIVTHDHFDHTRDVETLLTLLFELKDRAEKKAVDFLCSQGTFVKYKTLLMKGIEGGYLNPIHLHPGQMLTLTNWKDRMTLKIIRALHHEFHDNAPVGFIFELKQPECVEPFRLGITGDTAWRPGLYRDFADVDLLIAHLGTVEKKNGELLKSHLGLKGLGLLIKGVKPKLTVVTEFGEEVGERRYQLCKTLQKITDCNVIPGELETEIRIPSIEGRIGSNGPFLPVDNFIASIYKAGGL